MLFRSFAHSSVVANFLFPLTAYLRKDEKAANSITPLVNTTPQAWAESDWASLKRGKVTFDKGQDHQGQMDLAYAVEGKKPEGQSQPSARALKVAVFANAIFASNNLLDKVGNRDLILNAISWLADEDRFLSIRAKEDPDALKPYSNNLINLILLLSVFLIPISLIGAGTFVWWRRSKL